MKSKEFLKNLKSLADELRANIEAHMVDWDDSPEAVAERVEKVNDPVTGFEYFVMNYFPHYLRNPDQSELHKYLFKRLPKILTYDRSINEVFAAPRGEAKSTIATRLFSLWCVVTENKRYIAILSDTLGQSISFIESIKAELEVNTRIKIDFPKAFGEGRTWQVEEIVTSNGIKIKGGGQGKSLRGWVFGAYRPDLILLDDLENDKNVTSSEQRDKLEKWIESTVKPLGVAGEKTDIIYIGTVLHYDSVLNRYLDKAGWNAARFQAIVRYPDDMTMWDIWEAMYNAKREDEAEAYYLANKKAMDKGAKVSWKARPLYVLMVIRASNHTTFDSEYQNNPNAGSDAIFNDSINYWIELPHGLLMFGAVDPSLGKGQKNDPSAIIVGGYHQQTGTLYIIEADIKRRIPTVIITDVIRYQKQYNCLSWAFEAVQFQEFLRTVLVDESKKQHIPVPAKPVYNTIDKILRIQGLEPPMFNKAVLLHPDQKTLISQFQHFPNHKNDDGPDGVEMVYKHATAFMQIAKTETVDIPEPSLYDGVSFGAFNNWM